MHLARAIGTVHATRKDPNVEGATMLLLQPIDGRKRPVGQTLAAVDTVGAGVGEIVYYTTAYEAVMPWKDRRPEIERALIDAAVIGIVDDLESGMAP